MLQAKQALQVERETSGRFAGDLRDALARCTTSAEHIRELSSKAAACEAHSLDLQQQLESSQRDSKHIALLQQQLDAVRKQLEARDSKLAVLDRDAKRSTSQTAAKLRPLCGE
jgi:type IV secretory pathway VirJ component